MAEERVVLAGVSDRAAVAGQTHKHVGTVPLTASRNRPVRASLPVTVRRDGDVPPNRNTPLPDAAPGR